MADPIPRDLLAKYFGDDPRLMAAFEDQSIAVAETSEAVGVQKEATDALQDAYFLTLSPNSTLPNERVLEAGPGISLADDGANLTIGSAIVVQGGFNVTFTAVAGVNLNLPANGTLATIEGDETLSNKALSAPRLISLGDYADDIAAAAAGVPVGGVYRTGSALKVRVS